MSRIRCSTATITTGTPRRSAATLALDSDRPTSGSTSPRDYSQRRRPSERRSAAELADLPDRRRHRAGAADQSRRLRFHRRGPRRACPIRPSSTIGACRSTPRSTSPTRSRLRSITAYRELEHRRLRRHRRDPARDRRRLRRRRPEPAQPGIPGHLYRRSADRVAGLYYLREHIISHQEAYADDLIGPLLGNPTFLRTIDDDLVTTSYAAYANLSFEITPDAEGLGRRPLHAREQGLFPHHLDLLDQPAADAASSPFTFDVEDDWDNFSPMAVDRLSVRTERDGLCPDRPRLQIGRLQRPRQFGSPSATQYEPETVPPTKRASARRSAANVRLNFTAFYQRLRNFQARVSGTGTDPVTGLPSPVLAVLNAGQLDIKGAELEAGLDAACRACCSTPRSAISTPNMTSSPTPASRAAAAPSRPRPSRRTGPGGSAASMKSNLGDAGFLTSARSCATVPTRRSRSTTPISSAMSAPPIGSTACSRKAIALVDARIVYESSGAALERSASTARTSSTQLYKTDGQEFSNIGSIRTVYYGAPRTGLRPRRLPLLGH